MGKNSWIKTIALILLGIAIDRLLVPNSQLQSILLSSKWGIPMIIGLIALILAVILWVYADYNSKKKTKRNDELKKIAYSIWNENGKQGGHDIEYWLKAEKIWKELQNKGN